MILGEVGEIYTGWMVMRDSIRSNWGGQFNSPSGAWNTRCCNERENVMKCSHRWGG